MYLFYISVPNDDHPKLSSNILSNNGSNGIVSSNGQSNGVESANGDSVDVNEVPAEPPVEGEASAVAIESSDAAAGSTVEPGATEVAVETPRRRTRCLPYTFHSVHGANIKLCSSGTREIFALGTGLITRVEANYIYTHTYANISARVPYVVSSGGSGDRSLGRIC